MLKMSIRSRIMSLFLIFTTGFLATVGTMFYINTAKVLKTSTESEFATLANQVADKIDRFIFERYGDIQVLAKNPLIMEAGQNSTEARNYLHEVRKAYQTYDNIIVLDFQGNPVVYSGYLSPRQDLVNIFERVSQGTIYVSNIQSDSLLGYGLNFAAPILNAEKKVTGAVVARMNFSALRTIINSVNSHKKSYAYLMNEQYQTIFHPYMKKKPLSVDFGKLISYNDLNQIKVIDAIVQLSNYPTQNLRWYCVIEQSKTEAFQTSYQLKDYTLTVIFSSIFVLITLGYLLSTLITLPIRRLVKQTEAFARGDYAKDLDIKSQDELGSLAKSINNIIFDLQSMMQKVMESSGQISSISEIREYFNRLMNDVATGIITIDAGGKITSFNQTASEITGFKNKETVGRSLIYDLPMGWEPILEVFEETLKHSKIFIKHITKINDKLTRDLTVILSTNFQKDNNNNILGVIIVLRKLEDFRKFEDSILRAKNLASLGLMTAGIAHDIRNPLTSIKGYAEFILKNDGVVPEFKEDLQTVVDEVNKLNSIIERYLIFARPKNLLLGQYDINELMTSLIKIIKKQRDHESSFKLMPESHKSENVSIEFIPGELPLVTLDSDQFNQALMNLILNAIQAMPHGGILTLQTAYEPKNNTVEILVKDTGEGIKPEDLDKIFEPFYTTKNLGTGLGLAITARIIEEHKGFIELSSSLGEGTAFLLKLPVENE